MSFVTNWLLLHVFTALLPPLDPNQEDYYARLGLDRRRSVTSEEIRRAYRSKSLQWHPDKIAQRQQHTTITPAEAAAKFQGIQEAYQVLSDPEKRKDYHFWNCSNVRYQFVHSNTANPAELFQNLSSARIRDKARLVIVVGILLTLLILPFILLASKVNQNLDGKGGLKDASYAALLTPIWMAFAGYFFMVAAVIFVTKNVTLGQIVGLMETASWLAGLVLLVQLWDDKRTISNYHTASMPFYFAAAFRILGRIVWIGVIRGEMSKMISVEHLQEVESEMLSGSSIEDLTEEELLALHSRYNVVNPDPMQVTAALEILKVQNIDLKADGQQEELEAVRVQCSPEYQAAAEQVSESRGFAINLLLFGFPLIPLTAAKIQGDITASWWVVITPLWVYWGYRMVMICFLCFGFGSGEEVVVVDTSDEHAQEAPPDEVRSIPQKGESESPAIVEEQSQPAEIEENDVEKNPNKTMVVVDEGDEDGEECEIDGKMFPTPYNKVELPYAPAEEEVLSEAPSDEGAWRESLPRDPPGMTPDEQELQRIEMERRKALFEAAQKAKVTVAKPAEAKKAPSPPPEPIKSQHVAPVDQADQANTDTNKNGDEKSEDAPEIDEEMFRQWQRMQEEADHSAMEAQAKAQWMCCSTIFQIVMVCLIVGKLEQDFPRPEDGSVGYSAYWILFPVFLLAGIVLCCCSVLICYMGDPNAIYESTHGASHEDETQKQQESDVPTVFMAPPPPEATAQPLPLTNDVEAPPPSPITEDSPAEDMNDLD